MRKVRHGGKWCHDLHIEYNSLTQTAFSSGFGAVYLGLDVERRECQKNYLSLNKFIKYI